MPKKTLLTLACAVAAAAGTALTVAAPASAAPATTRVILTPGQSLGGVSLAPMYSRMADDLTARGYPTTVVDVMGTDLRHDATVIGDAVDKVHREHPHDKIALVAHSVSGISARWYLKEQGGHDKVATYVAIGTAQYGSPASCTADIAKENCPNTPFINTLNAGDDTPGDTAYYGIRSTREFADGHLDGGQCRVTPIPELKPVPADYQHTVEPLNADVWDAVAASLAGKCEGKFVDDPDGVLTGRGSMLPDAPYYREYRG
ncbi:lipase [Gordonia sp. (in: high G+C Gram-positive bacteria)]|uniref:esterase/lipase family protein n=1 Tax=Gordonia sp. (in: high G+C Gram-positive bacteria) TaxID=84139 RepID=UPI00260BF1EE|nr:lipase [Gordonia sp. (in: high G+C Gram-positive bacteria)]